MSSQNSIRLYAGAEKKAIGPRTFARGARGFSYFGQNRVKWTQIPIFISSYARTKGLAVPKSMKYTRLFSIICLILFPVRSVFAAMPTAGLPIEPATSDEELYNEATRGPLIPDAAESNKSGDTIEQSKSFESGKDSGVAFGATLRLSMMKDGFGAQTKVFEYAQTWLALTQTLRYFKNDEAAALYRQRHGFLLGFDLQPWRKKFISPFISAQMGWEKFYRDENRVALDSFVIESSVGLELKLGRLASVVGQWTESFYPGLDESVFLPLPANGDPKRHAVAEVLFNLKWESRQ